MDEFRNQGTPPRFRQKRASTLSVGIPFRELVVGGIGMRVLLVGLLDLGVVKWIMRCITNA